MRFISCILPVLERPRIRYNWLFAIRVHAQAQRARCQGIPPSARRASARRTRANAAIEAGIGPARSKKPSGIAGMSVS